MPELQPSSRKPRPVPSVLRALGRKPLPDPIEIDGEAYHLREVFKNDFFAVTAMYANDERRIVLKLQRQASFFGLPLQWLGRILAAKEFAAMRHAQGIEGVPRVLGRWGPTGIAREFVPGQPLRKGLRVPDDFHDRLRGSIEALHRRGMAYVDLEKCENVLVGDDGRPYLFDFQIAWYVPRRWGGELPPVRAIRALFQRGDRYHLVKLKRRTRPDLMTQEELAASYRRPWYVRLHRAVIWLPLQLRRWVLDRIDPRRGPGERGRVEHSTPPTTES